MYGLSVGKAEAMQQIGDSTDRVPYPVLLVDMRDTRFRIGWHAGFKISADEYGELAGRVVSCD
jgi:hypothetical protein